MNKFIVFIFENKIVLVDENKNKFRKEFLGFQSLYLYLYKNGYDFNSIKLRINFYQLFDFFIDEDDMKKRIFDKYIDEKRYLNE